MIEWREFNSPECASGNVAGRKVLEVRKHDRHSELFVISLFGVAVDEHSTFVNAKLKAEELFKAWIKSAGYVRKNSVIAVCCEDPEKMSGIIRGLNADVLIVDDFRDRFAQIDLKVELPDLSGLIEAHTEASCFIGTPKKRRRRGQRQQDRFW